MFTKEQLQTQLREMGIQPTDTVLIHTSMKAIGEVENGAAGVIDAFCDYLTEGLFLVPTHTWEEVGRKNPVYDVRTAVPCIGALPRVAAFRPDGVRSLHPTHSIWAHGKAAAAFVAGEEHAASPCPVGFAWSRLADVHAKILLLGVKHNRNTFIHSIDELAQLPNRLHPEPFEITIIDAEGRKIRHPMHHHFCSLTDDISRFYVNFEKALISQGAQRFGKFGNAEVRIIDAHKCQEIILRIYQRTDDYDQFASFFEIPEELYRP